MICFYSGPYNNDSQNDSNCVEKRQNNYSAVYRLIKLFTSVK